MFIKERPEAGKIVHFRIGQAFINGEVLPGGTEKKVKIRTLHYGDEWTFSKRKDGLWVAKGYPTGSKDGYRLREGEVDAGGLRVDPLF